mmetsp:Transcript_26401/g.81575  ORF Transcript_26401/g.81575 Transcript_26401/m.81575 type:complete len:233 (+) Transcript_26401:213-911(+)
MFFSVLPAAKSYSRSSCSSCSAVALSVGDGCVKVSSGTGTRTTRSRRATKVLVCTWYATVAARATKSTTARIPAALAVPEAMGASDTRGRMVPAGRRTSVSSAATSTAACSPTRRGRLLPRRGMMSCGFEHGSAVARSDAPSTHMLTALRMPKRPRSAPYDVEHTIAAVLAAETVAMTRRSGSEVQCEDVGAATRVAAKANAAPAASLLAGGRDDTASAWMPTTPSRTVAAA